MTERQMDTIEMGFSRRTNFHVGVIFLLALCAVVGIVARFLMR